MDFFNKAYALTANDVSKSTIPFTVPGVGTPTPFVTSGVSPTPILTPTIYLDTTTTTLAVNQKVNIKIRINTANKTIKSFKFTIKYDPAFFQITDAQPTVPNVQINYNDLFFINDINQVDTSTGTININAATSEGTATVSGRVVAEFDLTSKKEGFSQVKILIEDSSLLDSNNTDILKTTGNPIDFIISNAQATLAPITVGPSMPAPTPTGTLPRNGILDDIGAANAFLLGAILIGIGAYLYKMQKNAKKNL